jgi:hypothetical protein
MIGMWQGSIGELLWENGTIDGTAGPLSELRELEGPVGPGAHFPGTEDTPNLQDHRDWYLAALTVLGPGKDTHIEGDVPDDVLGQADVVH